MSDQNNEIFTLRLENQHTAVLQNELQNKVNQLEQQLGERDKVILDLRKTNDHLSSRLLETTKNLRSHGPEFLESDKAWQTKHKALQEKFREELADKEQNWETRVKLLEEEKQDLAEKEHS